MDVEVRVRSQIEFYLSSSNLMKDKFLRPIVQADPEGYVDVAMFAGFPRIQGITKDLSCVVRALRKSTILELNKEGTRVRRKEPFVEYDTEANTVFAVLLTHTLRAEREQRFDDSSLPSGPSAGWLQSRHDP